MIRGARGGPLESLAAQLNHDVTHLQGQRLEVLFGQLASSVREMLARLDDNQALASGPLARAAMTGAERIARSIFADWDGKVHVLCRVADVLAAADPYRSRVILADAERIARGISDRDQAAAALGRVAAALATKDR